MTLSRTSLLALAVAAALPLAGAVHSQSAPPAPKPPPAPAAPTAPKPPTAAQQKEIDAARADLERAAKRLAELTGHRPGPGFGPHFIRDVDGMSPRPVIGVLLAPDADAGVRIAGVTPDGAAASAGLKTGDRLLRIGGKPIAGQSPEARVESARTLLQGTDEKTAVKLAYARDGREAEVSVTPKLDQRIMIFTGDGGMMRPGGSVVVRRMEGGPGAPGRRIEIETLGADGPPSPGGEDDMQVFAFSGDAPPADGRIERRVIRIECRDGGKDCTQQATAGGFAPHAPRGEMRLAEAFRWNGLNLASVDAQLGRYFGTDKGVLVLSTGPALENLQPGDVIQRVDGKPVDTPRAVMDALRGKPADSSVPVDYLRDRKAGSAKIKVPKAMPIASMAPLPPMPAMPPMPQKDGAAPRPPEPPMPSPPPRVD
jgi:membrane-associated protease RseP (regulator of RpoE activity)